MADPRNHRMPPVGVKLTTDVERRVDGFRARVRWTDPSTKKRVGRVSHVRTAEEVEEFFDQMRKATETGNDTTATLAVYAESIGDRWKRALDPTSTAENYDIGLRLRVLPALGHIQVAKLTAGMIDRTIDQWETQHSPSTIKNSIAPLVRVLDEAVRDDLISINPAKHRARRKLGHQVTQTTGSLRQYAIPDLATLTKLADACAKVHQSYSDHVMLAALLAARGSEVAGLNVGDVDWRNRIVWIERQHYPGKGGLVVKQTKGRRGRPVPILDALEPILERLTEGKEPDQPLLRGPRGGVLTTATIRDATHWDDLVKGLGLENLTRHGLRHTGATWMADAGVPLHVLQEILGHKSVETTKGYLHPDHRHLAEAARQANQFLAAPPTRRGTTRRDSPRL
ncbi:tyrosine-type recombinase/integrase [Gryllotalpicola ginsengisoli]|uniref:tyrosine-type recombinase/integrase n=1 Tax=Gryllotalpicola ginsengisoli TaxID=444608 RepID=UPI0003B4D610|nr:tyrosine-type recombinase/integrase [Gryllotalpicola ginsengisoli]